MRQGELLQDVLNGTRPNAAALLGGLCFVPFLVANAIVGNRIEPFFSLIRPGAHTSAREIVLLAVVLACIPLGAFVAARPLLARSTEVRTTHYLVNGGVSAFLLLVFLALAVGIGGEIYRCDVLGVPNCD